MVKYHAVRKRISMRLTAVSAFLATLSYCWAIWWVSALFESMAPHTHGAYETTMLSIVLVAPIPNVFYLKAIHWQLLSLVSFAIAFAIHNKSADIPDSQSAPFLAHAFVLFTLSCLNLIGLLASVVAIAYVIE